MGNLHGCGDPNPFRETIRNRFYPLGELCDREISTHRWIKTSYYHERTPIPFLGGSWFFWVETLFANECIPHFGRKS